MSNIMLWPETQQRPRIAPDDGPGIDEIRKLRMATSNNSPSKPKHQQHEYEITHVSMNCEYETLVLPGYEADDDEQHKQPMKYASSEVPDQNVSHILHKKISIDLSN